MGKNVQLSFSIQPFEGALAVIAILNGAPLIELVQKFESEKGFKPAGGYGGLIPEWFKYGPLDRYFLGEVGPHSYFGRMGCIYLLGCSCGEVGCWPLAARVKAGPETVVWDSFQQPRRPDRDYSDFGPFVFKLHEYQQAAVDLQA
jgi:hypothetical protein